MLPISYDYRNAITADTRRLRARVEITWTDPDIDASIQVTTNDKGRISYPGHATDTKEDPTYKYAALDGSCLLDGTNHPAPDDADTKYQMGWWGKQLSNTSGLFATPRPILSVRFVARTVLALKVVGDAVKEEWPVEFEIRLYDNTGLKYTESVTSNAKALWEKSIADQQLYDITRMELEIVRWSHPGRVVKILEFYSNILHLYEGDDIALLSLLEERETSKGSLPIGNITANELDLRLINIDDRFNEGNTFSQYHNLMKPNRKVRAWVGPVLPSGLVEYQPLGVFWTQDWNVPETELYADTSARDRMQRLDDTTYNCELYHNSNLYDRAIHILQDGGLEPSQYWVDTALQTHIVEWFWMEPCTHREALRQVVERCLGQAYTDRKGVIRVEGPDFIQMPT